VEADNEKVERFRKAVKALDLLSPKELASVERRLASNPGISPVVALFESGVCDHQDIELVEMLMAGDTTITGYELVDLLGRGGMGVVWKAKQTSLDRLVALKTISHKASSSEKLATRFEREATAVAKLSHPNIVSAVDFGNSGGRLFLAMEYVAGEDLGQYINRHGQLAEATALSLIRQVASGLAHASRHGIIHRDIKPANIMLVHDEDWTVASGGVPLAKITDFGLALLNESDQSPDVRLTSHQAAVGSPHYMAPEQLTGAQVDTRADIYALGATLFHLLVGRAPWQAQSLNRIVHDKVAGKFPVEDLERLKVSRSTIALITSVTANAAEKRPCNCQELIAVIDRSITQLAAIGTDTQIAPLGNSSTGHQPNAPFSLAGTAAPDETQTLEQRHFDQATQSGLTDAITSVAQTPASTSIDKRFSRRAVVVVMTPAVVLGIIFGWIRRGGRAAEPIELSFVGQPISLFDGRTIPVTGISEGGLGTSDGRIVMSGPAMSSIGFQLPDWQYLQLDAILETPPGTILDVAMGSGIANKRTPCSGVRIEDNVVTGGRFTKLDGRFVPTGQAIELKPGRQQHYLEVEKNEGMWHIRFYKNTDLQLALPVGDVTTEPLEIIFVAYYKNDAANSDSKQSIALSELSVTQMQPSKP
jgi:serine/threonine-protein kinase